MFTTKHQSENGIISCVIGIVSLLAMISSIAFSFAHGGDVPRNFGGVGMFAALGDLIGTIAAIISLRERDIFIWVPRIALIANIVLLFCWTAMVLFGTLFA